MSQIRSITKPALCLTALVAIIALGAMEAEASQGCPFDDGSCQEYCSQQGCNMGYCGHFAWIQCICRKCGDEWSWYDKVRYNPDKQVNQTELDSLKLNGTSPLLILTNGQSNNQTVQQQQPIKPKMENKPATLTTLLIPDLSENNGKLDLNDIPDENSEKFLDYLAKNHEKLVQATSAHRQQHEQSSSTEKFSEDEEDDESSATTGPSTTMGSTNSGEDDGTIEIQISSSDNQTAQQQPVGQTSAVAYNGSPVTRLLKMAVIERDDDEA